MNCSTCARPLLPSGPFDLSVTNRQTLTFPKRTIEWIECIDCFLKAETAAVEVRRERALRSEPANRVPARKRPASLPFAMQLEGVDE